MKTLLLLLFFALSSNLLSAQDWCHHGAKWHYSWGTLLGGGYDEYAYTSDTIVQGKLCHQLSMIRYSALFHGAGYMYDTVRKPSIYTYAVSDTIYFFYRTPGIWLPTYFFGVNVGDAIIIPDAVDGSTVNHAQVDSVGIMLLDTNHLRFYSFHITDQCSMTGYPSCMVVERIGVFNYNDLVPYWHCTSDDIYHSFCSYQDDSFAAYHANMNCDVLMGTNTSIYPMEMEIFSIFPNPAHGEIQIISNKEISDVILSISDISGRKVLRTELTESDKRINISALSEGLYILSISHSGKQTEIKKLIVSH